MMKLFNTDEHNQQGFTILELMIATSVLSVLLLIASAVFISIGNTYTKGVDGTELQNNVRNIAQDVAGTVQYSSSSEDVQTPDNDTGPNGEQAICVGGEEYSYMLKEIQGVQDTTTGKTFAHVLWKEQVGPDGCKTPEDLTKTPAAGQDLGITHEGLYIFTISDDSDSDNLVDIMIDAFEAAGLDQVDLTGDNSNCIGGDGSQFCFTSNLSTTVERRVQ